MKVLLAGASGALGTPLTRQLIAAGHDVIGITRSAANAERLRSAGARAVVADVLDRDNLLDAVRDVRADAVMHQLTALGTRRMGEAMRGTNLLRTTGTTHLLAAARAVGASRFVTQSIVFGYGYGDHGSAVITEEQPLAEPSGRLGAVVAAIRSAEEQVLSTGGLDGIALRYGLFYGDDSFTRMLCDLTRKRRLPVPSSGGGYATLVHLDDAAAATVAALDKGHAGQAYNIVDDEAVRWGDYFDTLAAALQAPRPRRVPGWLLRAIPYVHTLLHTSMRVSNAKARRELGWLPAVPNYRVGIPLITAKPPARP